MMHREQVLQQALALSPEDRAYVAAALEDSLSVAPAGPEAQEASSLRCWRNCSVARLSIKPV